MTVLPPTPGSHLPVTEGAKIGDEIRALKGWRGLGAVGFADDKDANDCRMMYRTSLDLEHFQMTKVSRDLGDSKVGHARTFSVLAYAAPFIKPGAVACHVAVHPNWVEGIDNPRSPVVAEFKKSMRALDAMLEFAKAMGWYRAVSGDFNSKADTAKPYDTVWTVLKRHRMAYETDHHGLDAVAWDRRLTLVDWTLIPKRRTGGDHPNWTVADLSPR